jgi:hypothetical protein
MKQKAPRPITKESPEHEHDRLRAQRERIAAVYGHQPKQGRSVMAVTPPTYAVRKQLREATLMVGREEPRG